MTENKNSFKSYQEQKMTGRLEIINQYIAIYKKQKVKFKNITELAIKLASEIAKEEGKPCNCSTLLRNDKYKAVMEDYYYAQAGVKKPKEVSNLLAELTLSNIERENMRLKQYITQLESRLDEIKQVKVENEPIKPFLTKDENEVAYLRKALNLLINHFEGLVAIDESGNIIDLSKEII